MYQKIQHPKTGKWHKIDSYIGNKLITGYAKKINQTGGSFGSRLNDILRMFTGVYTKYRTKQVGDKYILSQVEYNAIKRNFEDVERTLLNLMSTDVNLNPSHSHNATLVLQESPKVDSVVKKLIRDIKAIIAEIIRMHSNTFIRNAAGAARATVEFGLSAAPATGTAQAFGLSLFPELKGAAGRRAVDAANEGLGVWREVAELRRRARDERAELAELEEQQKIDFRQRAALHRARVDLFEAQHALRRAQPEPLGGRVGGLFGEPYAVANERRAVADAYAEIKRKQQQQAQGGLFGPAPVLPAFGPGGLGDGANDPNYKRAFNQYKANRARGKPGPAPFPGFGPL